MTISIRPATPDDLFACLDRLGIAHKTVSHPPLFTVEESQALRGKIPDEVFTQVYQAPKTDGSGYIRDKQLQALALLKEAGYICAITHVIGVVVPDIPGGLYSVLAVLEKNDINLEYTYAFTSKKKDGAYTIFHVGEKDTLKAINVLTENGVEVVTQQELDSI